MVLHFQIAYKLLYLKHWFTSIHSPAVSTVRPASVECNDEEAHLVEARVKCRLSDFLTEPDPKLLQQFLAEHDSNNAQKALGTDTLLVQISVFTCGGLVLAVSASHKIADATSLHIFIRLWAAINRGEYHPLLVLPGFNGATLLPPKESFTINYQQVPISTQSLTTRRFVFDVSKLASLKAEVGSRIQQFTPTNGQLILAIILRCALAASHQSKPAADDTTSRLTVLTQMVNLRKRIVPEILENEIGNWFWYLSLLIKENETGIHELVINMKKGLRDFCKEKANRFKGDDGILVVSEYMKEMADLYKAEKGINLYWSTRVCKFPLYEIDFGWGKPTWVISPCVHKNLILLLDTKGGDGIEAWVTLDEQEMANFECNEELLAFSSINPSVNY